MQKVNDVPGVYSPAGPYSKAVVANGFVFAAGQIGKDADGAMAGTDVRTQTAQVLRNLKTVLEAAGSGLEHVVKTNVYLTDLADFAAMNEVYATFVSQPPPARTTVGVALIAGAVVEMDMIAVLPEGK